ncbi:hypothetical protein F8388_016629 [Cannabis sativa]|uniref:Uncharacterized protein n=1 Tax=Cannabis sativa TaxID=3483 RepID=A0A7J6FAS5_CANSA|nr:hypothetical protein F8388_016629 [Cannabis sativa]
MVGLGSSSRFYGALVDRCRSLEESHTRLSEQLREMSIQKDEDCVLTTDSGNMADDYPGEDRIVGNFSSGSPYKKVLESIGHAVLVCSASSGEIVFWNRSAENLYGWRDYEVVSQRSFTELLIPEDYYVPLQKIMGRLLRTGEPWSGQFPFKTRSGKKLMAIVTKSPLYENGELAGVIVVASDAALINSMEAENASPCDDVANDQRRDQQRSRFKRLQWHPRPPIVPVAPEIASSVSNLATKVLAKLQIKGTGNASNENEHGSYRQNGTSCGSSPVMNEVKNESGSPSVSKKSPDGYFVNSDYKRGRPRKRHVSLPPKGGNSGGCGHELLNVRERNECNECFGSSKRYNSLGKLSTEVKSTETKTEESNLMDVQVEDEAQRHGKQFPSSGDSSSGSHGSSSSKGDLESNSVVDCEIHWDDLHIGEEIGHGFYAVVYRGIWNGSNVLTLKYISPIRMLLLRFTCETNTVKEHYKITKKRYSQLSLTELFMNNAGKMNIPDEGEHQLLDVLQIDIMKRLRHPNVLLFMGASYSRERLAIVTEFLPRGSLFKTLHKSNQALDIRRRLRMALDVTRGMNYLHRRNPPIVHRDLKSSNLLVDKNWTVKVGDFGLSRLKKATFLTTKSGRGTVNKLFSYLSGWPLKSSEMNLQTRSKFRKSMVVGVVGFMDRRLELPEGLDPQVESIIQDCWKSDPEQRPSFEDLIRRMSSLISRFAALGSRKSSEQ